MTDIKKRPKYYSILILVLMLIVPGFLYFVFRIQSKNAYHVLPIFGEKRLTGTFHSKMGRKIADTSYHQVVAFQFFNQFGDTVNTQQWDNKIVLVALFSSFDKLGATFQSTSYMSKLYNKYGRNKILNFCSISVDDEMNNTAFKNLAETFASNTKNWSFLQADSTQLYPFIRSQLLMDVMGKNVTKAEPIFSRKIVMLDSHRRIRGYYDVARAGEFDRLDAEILVLTTEEVRNLKDGR